MARTTTKAVILTGLILSGCAQRPLQESPAKDRGGSPLDGITAFAAQISGGGKLDEIVADLHKVPAAASIEKLRELRGNAGINQSARREAAYILARLIIKEGNKSESAVKEALSLFEEASHVPALSERSLKQMLAIAQDSGDEIAVRNVLGALRSRSESAETRAFCDYSAGQSFTRTNETDKALAAFQAARAGAPGSKYYLGAGYYLAESLLATGTPESITEAATLWREYLAGAADGRFAADVSSRLIDLANKGQIQLTAEDQERIGRVRYHQGRWQEAIDSFQAAGPTVNLYLRSICLMHLGQNAAAKDMLVNAIKSRPGDRFHASAATILGNPLSREKTLELWKAVLAANPTHADTALWNIAIRMSPPANNPYFQQILKSYPTSEFAPESAWWLFWNDVKAGDKKKFPQALMVARAAIARYPDTKAAARLLFWSGKIHERLGQKDLAQKAYRAAADHFPAYYYGFRARQKLLALSGKTTGDIAWSTRPERRHPQATWRWPDTDGTQDQEVDKELGPTYSLLFRLGQFDECLEIGGKRIPALVRAWMLANSSRPLEAINAASRETRGKATNHELWQFSYPLAYADLISQNASERKVDPVLVHALIREESRYNPMALSRSNALGLMQLLPGTAYGVAKRIGVQLNSREDVYRPEINIKLGTDYLAYAVRRFGGNALMGVASYNGGPGAVSGWMRRHASSSWQDPDVFVENIPYRETRDYVRKVFGSYWAYLDVYGNKGSQAQIGQAIK